MFLKTNSKGMLKKGFIMKQALLLTILFGVLLVGCADLVFKIFPARGIEEMGWTGADLHRANLTGANLRQADLRRADLREANLRLTDLIGANLTGVKLINISYHNPNTKYDEGSPLDIYIQQNK